MSNEQRPEFDYHDESQSERLARKSKESPFMVIGIGGFLSAVGYGVYKYKNRGSMSTSVFLMQFRVISQGIAVGAITAGMAYTLFNTYVNKPQPIAAKAKEH